MEGLKQGDTLITCATIVQSYMMLITGPMLGISSGTQAILSYNYGAKEIQRVKQAEKYILLLCLCFTTFMFFTSRAVPVYFIRLFTQEGLTAKAVRLGYPYFYPDDYPSQLSICVCGRLYRPGQEQNRFIPVHVP